MLFLPGCALVNQYFDRKKGTAMSVIIGAASFGGIIWPLILQALFDHPKIGFAWGVRIAALLLAILLTISNVLMRPRLPPNAAGHASALVAGLDTPHHGCAHLHAVRRRHGSAVHQLLRPVLHHRIVRKAGRV